MSRDRRTPSAAVLAVLGLLLLAACGGTGAAVETAGTPSTSVSGSPSSPGQPDATSPTTTDPAQPDLLRQPPIEPPAAYDHHHAASHIFGHDRFLVAYYGTPGTGVLGVLGATPPEEMERRLHRAAAAFARRGQPAQEVFEIIVRVADPSPGPQRLYSHDIARASLTPYLRLAHRVGALVVLDIQPGRSPFLPLVEHWAWALRDPSVGLALDPEWRMHGNEVPGRTVGWVDASEINDTSAWLNRLQARDHLPEKLFLLHQFRTDMIHGIERVRPRPGLAMVQHVDGFGTPGQKRSTFHAVARPHRFFLGFKLFYRADQHLMDAAAVHGLKPGVRFVSYQ